MNNASIKSLMSYSQPIRITVDATDGNKYCLYTEMNGLILFNETSQTRVWRIPATVG